MHTIFVTNELMLDRGEDLIQPLLRKYGVKNVEHIPQFSGIVYELHEPLPRKIGILKVPKEVQLSYGRPNNSFKATTRYGFGWTDPRDW